MDFLCPQCNQSIDENDYNISTDIAYCHRCDAKYSLATLSSVESVDDLTFDNFQQACCQEFGRETTAIVPFSKWCRYIGYMGIPALFLFAGFSFFVFKIVPDDVSLGVTLIIMSMLLFCFIPELMGGLFFLAGKYKVSIEQGMFRVRTGIPLLRRSQRIDFDKTTVVRMDKSDSVKVNNKPVEQIAVETGGRKISFGILLSNQNKACLVKWLSKHVK